MPKTHYQPLGGNQMPRFGGPATMMRLPSLPSAEGLDACFVGVPFDIGTSNRSGARFGPRQIRAESCLIRPYNMATSAAPFDSLSVADIGDVAINTFNLEKSIEIIEKAYDEILSHNCRPLTLGGDHTVALPILRALKRKYGPVGMVHVDAHADINDTCSARRSPMAPRSAAPSRKAWWTASGWCRSAFGPRLLGGGFRLAPRPGLPRRAGGGVLAQIPGAADGRGAPAAGCRPRPSHLRYRRPRSLLRAGHRHAGDRRPHHHPGLEIIRGCRGLDIVACDMVEVAPPYDPSGNTALLAANLLFEMLCILPGVQYRN